MKSIQEVIIITIIILMKITPTIVMLVIRFLADHREDRRRKSNATSMCRGLISMYLGTRSRALA